MKLIIDAISNSSGGAKRHLSELLSYSNYTFVSLLSLKFGVPSLY